MMKSEEIQNLLARFESIACEYEGVECWSARELYPILGYAKWQTFEKVLDKAQEACQNAGIKTNDHFTGVSKMVAIGSGTERPVEDIMLTRYACYLVAQNGDPRKPEIAFAQNYFAVQTRVAEVIEQRILDYDRVQARHKLAETEKKLSGVLYERGVDDKGFGIIRSKGDQALFRMNTSILKRKLGAPENRAVADFLPTLGIKAKDFAAEMTSVNVQQKDLHGVTSIECEHVENNKAVRKMLLERGIRPENMPAGEDIKKVERRLASEEKKILPKKK
jgi:DNA-damage-inducible protein D